MIQQAGDLLHLFHVAGEAILLFFGQGAEAGDDMTNHLSATIEKWNAWMRSIEGQKSLHDFFHQSAGDTENFFGALVPLLRTFTELARALQPVTGGMLAFLHVFADITTELARIPGMSNILKTFGIVMGAAFAYNKIAKWSAEIRKAAVALGILEAAEAGAAGTSAVTTGAGAATAASGAGALESGALGAGAGAAASKGGFKGLIQKGSKWILPVTMGVIAIEVGDEVKRTLKDKVGNTLGEALTFGPDELARKEVNTVKNALTTQKVKVGTIDMNGLKKQLPTVEAAFKKLRSGVFVSLSDINMVVQKNANAISTHLPRGSEEARKKTAENFRAAAHAIKSAMGEGLISVDKGTKRMRELIRNAKLVEGADPLGLAKGFTASWAKAGNITLKERTRMIGELKKMPPEARKQAFEMMIGFGQQLVRAGELPKSALKQVDLLNQNLIASFGSANSKASAAASAA
jgi:hypothetical protein